jgi:hypothetical protein
MGAWEREETERTTVSPHLYVQILSGPSLDQPLESLMEAAAHAVVEDLSSTRCYRTTGQEWRLLPKPQLKAEIKCKSEDAFGAQKLRDGSSAY